MFPISDRQFQLKTFPFLVTAGVGIPAAIIACNVGLGMLICRFSIYFFNTINVTGTCMAACVAAGCSPIPWNGWYYGLYDMIDSLFHVT